MIWHIYPLSKDTRPFLAGSGKTNVCVEKIVYCACRNYRGAVLYTTFSRGLLSETRERVDLFARNIDGFIAAYEGKRVVFLDSNHFDNIVGLFYHYRDACALVYILSKSSVSSALGWVGAKEFIKYYITLAKS